MPCLSSITLKTIFLNSMFRDPVHVSPEPGRLHTLHSFTGTNDSIWSLILFRYSVVIQFTVLQDVKVCGRLELLLSPKSSTQVLSILIRLRAQMYGVWYLDIVDGLAICPMASPAFCLSLREPSSSASYPSSLLAFSDLKILVCKFPCLMLGLPHAQRLYNSTPSTSPHQS